MKVMLSGTKLHYILVDKNNNEIEKYASKQLANCIQPNHKGSTVKSLDIFQKERRISNTSTTMLQLNYKCTMCGDIARHACETDPEFECPYNNL